MAIATLAHFIDWIAASIRWLAILGIVLSLAIMQNITWPVVLVLLLAACWNIVLTVLAASNRRISSHRPVILLVDMIVAYAVFALSGRLDGGMVWTGVLPLISGALYFGWLGAFGVAVLNLLVLGWLASFSSPTEAVALYSATVSLLYIGVGATMCMITTRLNRLLDVTQRGQASSRKEAEKVERDRKQALYNLISELSATLNYQRVLETALDLSMTALASPRGGEEKLVEAVLLFEKNESNESVLRVGSARRLTPSDTRITLPGTAGLIGLAIDEGEAQLSEDISEDPELSRMIALRACKAAYCLPLRTGMDTYGVLLFAHPEPAFFTPEHREVLDIVAHQAVIALQNARLYQDLEQEKERIMEIQEEARKKMARDLHDGPTQSVAAIAMRVNFARRLLERDAKAAAEELYKIEDLARRTTKEIRHMLFTLRPLVLESQGLLAALESMAEKTRETYNQNVIIQADCAVMDDLEMGKQGVIFAIAEEAVNNARKHAKARHIWVRLKGLRDDLAILQIEDDGVGFDIHSVDSNYENRGSLGMVNMRERAELVNGLLHIDSAPGRGTRIQVAIPLSEAAADRIRRGI